MALSASASEPARHYSTVLQHGITARYYSTVLQHGITARYYSTVLQHGITARYYSTVLQHVHYCQNCTIAEMYKEYGFKFAGKLNNAIPSAHTCRIQMVLPTIGSCMLTPDNCKKDAQQPATAPRQNEDV